MIKQQLFGLVFLGFMYSLTASATLPTRAYLPLSLAKKAAEACIAFAEQKQLALTVMVVDRAGREVYLERMDNAFLKSLDIALLKAQTAAQTFRSSGTIGDIVYRNPARPVGLELVPGLVVFAGGLPIKAPDGQTIAAIGVSGATSDVDEACAQTAIDAIKNDLVGP